MPTPGYVFRDGGPIPDSELQETRNQTLGHQGNSEPVTRTSTSNSSYIDTPTSSSNVSNAPSDSHALANAQHEEKGAVQKNQKEGEVRDMGWREQPTDVLVGGLPNEELWTLVRRFNKQMYHVKATKDPLLGGLDLNIVDEDEFSPDKLRANVERLYMTVIIGMMAFGKHIARLRSWREPRRTAAFCTVSAVRPTTYLVLISYCSTGIRDCLDFRFLDTPDIDDSHRAYSISTRATDSLSPCSSRLGRF